MNCELSSFKLENAKEMLNEQASSVYDLNKVGFLDGYTGLIFDR